MDIEAREHELVQKEKDKQDKMKQEMQGFLDKNKHSRNLEIKERKEIDLFYRTKSMQDLMEKYSEQLFHLYKYYTLQGDVSIGGDLEKKMNMIQFNTWVKLGYNTNVTPHLISSDDMVAIYRTLEREYDVANQSQDSNSIDYEHFKKGLIRITILAKTQSIEAEVNKRQKFKKSRQNQNRDLEEVKEPTKNHKLKELEKQISKVEKLQKIKVVEKRVSKEFDVSLINEDDVERFYKFLQLDHEDDKYAMDRKINNKEGYSKNIIFEGLGGSYADNYSQRDISSTYSKQNDGEKYSIIHRKDNSNEDSKLEPNKEDSKLESSDTNKLEPKNDAPKNDKYSNIVVDVQPDSESVGKEDSQKKPDDESSKPREDEVSEEKAKEKQQPFAEISQEELDNQPARTENINDPEGKKEEWAVDK